MSSNNAPQRLLSGLVLTRSTVLTKHAALCADRHEDGSGAAITINGDNITVDFGGATLRGTAITVEPDKRLGTGLKIVGRNVTVKNLKVHGYKIGIYAENAPGLRLENCDGSYNWKQRLGSTLEREDLADWMSFHQNEKAEWLRYGAAIYLVGCDGFTVKNCRAVGGQCGLMLTRCNRGLVVQNNFSFLSGLGLGMYRSSDNKILQNKLDWCVRGYSHGVYNRGQDSAGILVFEQSSRNLFAYNSVTHGGDGFFLWAGQTTMDTGQGGCDDNLLYGNDFSHAPTNGIEATFSRNSFVNNLVLECWHGVWGGYSYQTKIVGNHFGGNAEAIAIEHGRDNVIADNLFDHERIAIRLWKNASENPDWAYPKKHETTSRDYRIEHNRFVGGEQAISVTRTDRVIEKENQTLPAAHPATMQPSGNTITATETDVAAYQKRFITTWKPTAPVSGFPRPEPLKNAPLPFLGKDTLRGRRYILVDHWGPYDFKSPLLWPRGDGHFEVLGPKGRWRVVSAKGAKLSQSSGTVPGVVTITPSVAGGVGLLKIELEYLGAETTDYRGIVTPQGKPVRFGHTRFVAPIAWKVAFYPWSKAENPSEVHSAPEPTHFKEQIATTPLATLTTENLDFAGYGWAKNVPNNRFLTLAEGNFTIPPGQYILDVTTDDGCRIWLDGKPILTDAWKYQGPTLYPIALTLGGKHQLRVEHFQIDGYAALKVALRPGTLKP